MLVAIGGTIKEHRKARNKVRIVPCGNQLSAGSNKTEWVVKILPFALRSNRVFTNCLDERSSIFHPLQATVPQQLVLPRATGGINVLSCATGAINLQYLVIGEAGGMAFHPRLGVDRPQGPDIDPSETSIATAQLPAVGEFEETPNVVLPLHIQIRHLIDAAAEIAAVTHIKRPTANDAREADVLG